jgi:hypothetical protein
LTRRQRLANELLPWVPAIAGTLGFATGIFYLAVSVSTWLLVMLVVPLILFRGLFALLFDLLMNESKWVEIAVEDCRLHFQTSREHLSLSLSGIIQVFRSGDTWTVLHYDGAVLTIPAEAVSDEQIDYLKSFARNAAVERKAAQSGS